MQGEFTFPPYFDYFATFAWAISGAVVGARRGYDLVGVFIIALVSSTGGGLIRDGFLLQRTPALLTDGVYLVLIAFATVLIGVVAKWLVSVHTRAWLDKFIELIDAVGVPAFAIVGMQMALAEGVSLPGVVLVGVINGTGGAAAARRACARYPASVAAGPVLGAGRSDRMPGVPRAQVWMGYGRDARRARHHCAVFRRPRADRTLQLDEQRAAS